MFWDQYFKKHFPELSPYKSAIRVPRLRAKPSPRVAQGVLTRDGDTCWHRRVRFTTCKSPCMRMTRTPRGTWRTTPTPRHVATAGYPPSNRRLTAEHNLSNPLTPSEYALSPHPIHLDTESIAPIDPRYAMWR